MPGGGLPVSTWAQGAPSSGQPAGAPLLMVVAACRIQLGLRELCRKGASLKSTGRPANAGPCAYITAGSMTCREHTHNDTIWDVFAVALYM